MQASGCDNPSLLRPSLSGWLLHWIWARTEEDILWFEKYVAYLKQYQVANWDVR